MLRLLYDEARMNILEGRYPCDPEHWLALGALACAIELGTGLEEQKVIAAIRYPFVEAHRLYIKTEAGHFETQLTAPLHGGFPFEQPGSRIRL